jgi:hypothetical protein
VREKKSFEGDDIRERKFFEKWGYFVDGDGLVTAFLSQIRKNT